MGRLENAVKGAAISMGLHQNLLFLSFNMVVDVTSWGASTAITATTGQETKYVRIDRAKSSPEYKAIVVEAGRKKSEYVKYKFFNGFGNVHIKAGEGNLHKIPDTGNFMTEVKITFAKVGGPEGVVFRVALMQNGEGNSNPWYLRGKGQFVKNGIRLASENNEQWMLHISRTKSESEQSFDCFLRPSNYDSGDSGCPIF